MFAGVKSWKEIDCWRLFQAGLGETDVDGLQFVGKYGEKEIAGQLPGSL